MATSGEKIKQLKNFTSRGAEFNCYVVIERGAHLEQLTVLVEVEEVPVDMSPKGFLFYLFFFFAIVII